MKRVLPIISVLILLTVITEAYAQYTTTTQPQTNQNTIGAMGSPGIINQPMMSSQPSVVTPATPQPAYTQQPMTTPPAGCGQPGCLVGNMQTPSTCQQGLGPFPYQMAGPACGQLSSQAAMAGAGPMGMTMTCGSITVDDTTVYVLRGNEILRFDKSSMQYIDSTPLPTTSAKSTPSAYGRGPLLIRPEVQQLISSFQTMNTAQAEQVYMKTIIQAHAGAIAWSRIASVTAEQSVLRKFARELINDESAVNCKFDTWLKNWYDTQQVATLLPGDQAILNQLQNMTCNRDFEIAYLRALITHFSEAVALTNAFLPKACHLELKIAAAAMATEHSKQIQQLRTWLSQWYNINC